MFYDNYFGLMAMAVGAAITAPMSLAYAGAVPGVISVSLALALLEIQTLSLHRNVVHNNGLDLSSFRHGYEDG